LLFASPKQSLQLIRARLYCAADGAQTKFRPDGPQSKEWLASQTKPRPVVAE
jgi:hypothetical protein